MSSMTGATSGSRRATPFIDLVLAGREDVAAVDDYIDRWHAGESPDLDLHEHLGMTTEEWEHFGSDERNIFAILRSRQRGVPLLAAEDDMRSPFTLAARSKSPNLVELEERLRDLGLLDGAG